VGGLPIVKSREVLRVLVRAGFAVVDQEGSHIKLRKGPFTVIVPDHRSKDMPKGTLGSILKQCGLTVEEFKSLL
jgi:predicted RNA binding protein YcfA (HicA-like mRNA interferase family)